MHNQSANFIKRFFATGLDYQVFFFATVLYSLFVDHLMSSESYKITLIGIAPVVLFWFFYFVISEYLFSRTLMKYLFKISVTKLDNSKLTLLDSLKRRIFDPIDIVYFPLSFWIAIISSSFRRGDILKASRLGDYFAKTDVIDGKDV